MTWRYLALGLLAMTAAVAADKPIRTPADIPAEVRVERDVDFLGGGREEKADLYLPAGGGTEARFPAVLIIHGGGFTGGDKAASREINIGSNLALNGIVGMSVNYELSKAPGHATWPRNIHDCKTAVRWLRKNARRLRVDPERIGVIGGSAGGVLAALVTLTRKEDGLEPAALSEFSSAVKCGVDLYGPGDFTTRDNLQMLGKTRAEAPELYKQSSAVTYARKGSPPLLIMHGTGDKTVPVQESEHLAEVMKKASAPHELIIIPDAPHTFDLQPKQRDLRDTVIGFFKKHLGG